MSHSRTAGPSVREQSQRSHRIFGEVEEGRVEEKEVVYHRGNNSTSDLRTRGSGEIEHPDSPMARPSTDIVS